MGVYKIGGSPTPKIRAAAVRGLRATSEFIKRTLGVLLSVAPATRRGFNRRQVNCQLPSVVRPLLYWFYGPVLQDHSRKIFLVRHGYRKLGIYDFFYNKSCVGVRFLFGGFPEIPYNTILFLEI